MPKRNDLVTNFETGLSKAGAGLAPPSPELVEDNRAPESIDLDHEVSVRRGLEQSRRGEYATEAEVEAAFAQFDP